MHRLLTSCNFAKNKIMKPFFDLSVEEMKSYGYKIVDIIAEHYKEIENKKPVTSASR